MSINQLVFEDLPDRPITREKFQSFLQGHPRPTIGLDGLVVDHLVPYKGGAFARRTISPDFSPAADAEEYVVAAVRRVLLESVPYTFWLSSSGFKEVGLRESTVKTAFSSACYYAFPESINCTTPRIEHNAFSTSGAAFQGNLPKDWRQNGHGILFCPRGTFEKDDLATLMMGSFDRNGLRFGLVIHEEGLIEIKCPKDLFAQITPRGNRIDCVSTESGQGGDATGRWYGAVDFPHLNLRGIGAFPLDFHSGELDKAQTREELVRQAGGRVLWFEISPQVQTRPLKGWLQRVLGKSGFDSLVGEQEQAVKKYHWLRHADLGDRDHVTYPTWFTRGDFPNGTII